MPTPKDMPRELRGLWVVQYEPREKLLLRGLTYKAVEKYKKASYVKKMATIDKLQHEGRFD